MNTTLEEYLSDLRGMYSHGYFYMYINGDFNPRLRNMSVPFVYTSDGRYFYPATTTSPRGSGDIAMMVSTHRIYSFLIQRSNGVCPLVMFCDHNHNGCYTEPWTETNCTIEPALKKIGVYGKPIIFD